MAEQNRLTRRDFLKAAAAMAGLATSGGLLNACVQVQPAAAPAASTPAAAADTPAPAAAPAGFDWQQSSGETINVLLTKNPWSETLEPFIPEFEEMTGITVEYENIPEIQARQKITVDFAGGGTVDCFFTSLHVEKRRFSTAGWYEDLKGYLEDATLTAAEYDFENDLFGASKDAATSADGAILALPIFTDPWAYFSRKDLLEEKGLKAPATFEEMQSNAEALHSPPDLYGYIARGLKNANAIGFTWMLRSFGSDVLTGDRQANLTSEEAVQAMDLYAGMLRDYAPPGVVNFNWQECASAFAQGQVGMYFDGINFALQFEDPTKSTISGKVGYSLLPAGPAGQVVPTFTTGMAVSALSANKQPAYLFCQWATGKETALKEQLAGVGTSRKSVWENPEVQSKSVMPQDWTDTYLQCLEIGKLGLPEIVGVTEYRDIIGVAIQRAIEGEEATVVLEQAQQEFQDLLEKTES